MRTFIGYREPRAQDSAPPEAYCQTDAGEVWGPLRPFRPHPSAASYFPAAKQIDPGGKTLEEWLREIYQNATVEEPELQAGQHYPRVWRSGRTIEFWGEASPRVDDMLFFPSFVNSLEQIEGLFDDLAAIFRVVHPATDNLAAYGGSIRDILILACTEVEAQWKNVLEANNVTAKGSYYRTPDYVKLLPIMKLDSYKLALIRYPQIPAIAPFAGWDVTKPTQTLRWYEAYNSVKHDRESAFKQATLGHVIHAVAACVVMLAAQFGVQALHRHRLNNLFEFKTRPMWGPREYYYQPVPNQDWVPVDCPI